MKGSKIKTQKKIKSEQKQTTKKKQQQRQKTNKQTTTNKQTNRKTSLHIKVSSAHDYHTQSLTESVTHLNLTCSHRACRIISCNITTAITNHKDFFMYCIISQDKWYESVFQLLY